MKHRTGKYLQEEDDGDEGGRGKRRVGWEKTKTLFRIFHFPRLELCLVELSFESRDGEKQRKMLG